MNKFMKYLKRTLLVVLSVAVLLVSGVFIFGKVTKSSDMKKIKDYGEKVDVFGDKMNLYITGEGEKTIVLLPGYGTIAPKISFEPVIEKMKDEYKIVLVEPFGYGLSDITKRERTVDNIVEEIHEALSQKGIDDFVFMGHSIAGIYMLSYIDKYPNEASAYIGIDTSVPNQPMAGINTTPLKIMDTMGFLQIGLREPFGSVDVPSFVKEEDVMQYTYFARTSSLNKNLLNEMDHIQENFNQSKAYHLPKDLPVYLFVQEVNESIPNWGELHEEQKNSVEHGKMMLIDGDHFLHFEHSEIIVKETKAFLNDIFGK